MRPPSAWRLLDRPVAAQRALGGRLAATRHSCTVAIRSAIARRALVGISGVVFSLSTYTDLIEHIKTPQNTKRQQLI